MSIQKIDLDNNNELIIRTKEETFIGKGKRATYRHSFSEVILKNNEQSLCIGLRDSNTYTGKTEFVQYTPQCILFIRGNNITKTYFLERVFDIESMSSLLLTKDEISERYGIELSEEIRDIRFPKKHVKKKMYGKI